MSRIYVCAEPGCTNGRDTGHALYRVSPKGELFVGKCEEHYHGQPDPIAQAIERRNHELAALDGTEYTGGTDGAC